MRGSFGRCAACHERIGADKQPGPRRYCLELKADSLVNNQRCLLEGGSDKQERARRLQPACIAFGGAFIYGQSRQRQAQSRRSLVQGLIDALKCAIGLGQTGLRELLLFCRGHWLPVCSIRRLILVVLVDLFWYIGRWILRRQSLG